MDVAAVGNAIMDLVADVDHAFLARHGFAPGRMLLADRDTALAITSALPAVHQCAGGSAANTAVGVAMLGGRSAFFGRCADDALGRGFQDSLEAAGVRHRTMLGPAEPPTGRSFVVVTPDHERSMMTFPGAAATLESDHVASADIADAAIVFIEGYLFYAECTAEAARTAAAQAAAAGRTVALSLSDPLCVEHNRDAFRELLETSVSLLFANQHEITALYETDNFEEAARRAGRDADIAFLTRSAEGSIVVQGDRMESVAAVPAPDGVRDVTGAGDIYAAGVIYGLCRGLEPAAAAHIGAICASVVIGHHGARPQTDLRQLVNGAGLLR